jgi:hypothetical protein
VSGKPIGGRAYARSYSVTGRRDLHAYLESAVLASGARNLFASEPTVAPFLFSLETPEAERLALMIYAFRANPPPIKGRPADEHRIQIRYGSEASWIAESHPVGQDEAQVDVTLVLGVHPHSDLLVGLDPLLYAELPMGISVEFKDAEVEAVSKSGWEAWERETRPGVRRTSARTPEGLETLVGFGPNRLLDYARFEREATGLGLDPPLRLAAAERTATEGAASSLHELEQEWGLSGNEILDLINRRFRLKVATRGGVAEHHLARVLSTDPGVAEVVPIDEDAKPDLQVRLADGRSLLVECKNVSPTPLKDGTIKVEVQKTRGKAPERYYLPSQFDAVAACLWPVTGKWEFRYQRSDALKASPAHPGRIAPIQHLDDSWVPSLSALSS